MTIRIGHCIHGLGLGGAQEVIRTIASRASSCGLEHIMYSCEGGPFEERLVDAGATVRIIPRLLPKFDPIWVTRLASAMRADAVDLIHTHLFGDSLHGILAARRVGRPSLMTLHLPFRNVAGFQRRGYVWLLPRATHVVACSEEARRTFAEAAPAGVEIETIPNGVDDVAAALTEAQARDRLGLPRDATVVAAIGRLAAEKGLPTLLAAFARATDGPAARLLLVGDGEEREALEQAAADLGIRDRVVFAGQRSDVRDLLPAFDVVASSSLGEGLPLSLLESMCAGRALVWTDVDGMRDIVRPDREALLVPTANVDALADALTRLLSDAELRARLGSAARARFEESFTSSQMVHRYHSLYESLAKSAERPTSPNRKAA